MTWMKLQEEEEDEVGIKFDDEDDEEILVAQGLTDEDVYHLDEYEDREEEEENTMNTARMKKMIMKKNAGKT